jgi:hypothetical protein
LHGEAVIGSVLPECEHLAVLGLLLLQPEPQGFAYGFGAGDASLPAAGIEPITLQLG